MGPAMAPNELETLWRTRLQEALSRLNYVRAFLRRRDEVHGYYHQAIELERLASQEYRRILQIFTALVVDGIVPDEAAWERRMAPVRG